MTHSPKQFFGSELILPLVFSSGQPLQADRGAVEKSQKVGGEESHCYSARTYDMLFLMNRYVASQNPIPI